MGLVAFGLRYSGVIETNIQQICKYNHLKLSANFIIIEYRLESVSNSANGSFGN